MFSVELLDVTGPTAWKSRERLFAEEQFEKLKEMCRHGINLSDDEGEILEFKENVASTNSLKLFNEFIEKVTGEVLIPVLSNQIAASFHQKCSKCHQKCGLSNIEKPKLKSIELEVQSEFTEALKFIAHFQDQEIDERLSRTFKATVKTALACKIAELFRQKCKELSRIKKPDTESTKIELQNNFKEALDFIAYFQDQEIDERLSRNFRAAIKDAFIWICKNKLKDRFNSIYLNVPTRLISQKIEQLESEYKFFLNRYSLLLMIFLSKY